MSRRVLHKEELSFMCIYAEIKDLQDGYKFEVCGGMQDFIFLGG